MATNNAINMTNQPYYFCVELSSSQNNVTGDGTTHYVIPYDTIRSDTWGIYNPATYTFALPKGGYWALGMSIKYSANYAAFQNETVALTITLGGSADQNPLYIQSSGFSTTPTSQTQMAFLTNDSVRNNSFGMSMYGAIVYSGLSFVAEYTVLSGTSTNDAGILYDAAYPTMVWGYLISEFPSPLNLVSAP